MNLPVPKYLIAQERPDPEGSGLFLVRTRRPLAVARAEPLGLFGIQLQLWSRPPFPSRAQTHRTCRAFARLYAAECDGWPDDPELESTYTLVEAEGWAPPSILFADAPDGRWEGAISLASPAFALEVGGEDGGARILGFRALEPGEVGEGARDRLARFALDFLEEETKLPWNRIDER